MKTSDYLTLGNIYTRIDLQNLFNITDSTIRNGVFKPREHNSIWFFITEDKTPDRTQYSDFLDGDILICDGQTKGRTDAKIINHIQEGNELIVFYRKRKYEYPLAAFKYEGSFIYVSHTAGNPSHFILQRKYHIEELAAEDIEGYREEEFVFEEGGVRQRLTNYFERNPRLRAAAIMIHGTSCQVCGFDFLARYGEHGRGFIEVHHNKPISTINDTVQIDPAADMSVLCANCHRMIHRRRDNILSVAELRDLISNGNF